MADPHTGTKLVGKYRLIAELGRGGMADVYLAVMEGAGGFHKLQVIKKLRPQLVDEADFLAMFLDEARLAARLNHPNVVQTLEVGCDGNQHFIAMEHLDGQPLHVLLSRAARRRPLPLAMHVRILSDALAGLQHAHELMDFDGTPLHVVHRDVSPHNIFVTYEGQVKVVDFGIAKAASTLNETRTGILKGKITYMAPEQACGASVDLRADLFSVGVMLWEALAGRRMWQGLQEMQILHRLANAQLPSVRATNPSVPPALERICEKALAILPSDRYESAAAMQVEIERYLENAGLLVLPKDIGRFGSDLFQDKRAELRTAIEHQLRELSLSHRGSSSSVPVTRLETRPSSHPSVSRFLVPDSVPPPASSLAGVLMPRDAASLYQEGSLVTRLEQPSLFEKNLSGLSMHPEALKSKRFWMGATVVFALLLASMFGWSLYSRYAFAQKTTPSVVALAPVAGDPSTVHGLEVELPVPVPNTAPVSITIQASPPEAQLFFDDTPLAANPYRAKFPRTGTTHRIRAEAPGFIGKTEMVTLADELLECTLLLEREKPAVKPRSIPGPSGRRPSSSHLHEDPWSR